jgi:hypothetical protein
MSIGQIGGGAAMRLVRRLDVLVMGAALVLVGAIACGFF